MSSGFLPHNLMRLRLEAAALPNSADLTRPAQPTWSPVYGAPRVLAHNSRESRPKMAGFTLREVDNNLRGRLALVTGARCVAGSMVVGRD